MAKVGVGCFLQKILLQIVAKNIYLSDGPSKKYSIGRVTLEFKHKSLKEVTFKYTSSALVVQIIKTVGEKHLTKKFLKELSKKFTPSEWLKIKKDTSKVTE